MEWRGAASDVERTPNTLAINGNDVAFFDQGQTLDPGNETQEINTEKSTQAKAIRIKSGIDTAYCVVRRNPIWQVEKATKPLYLRAAKALHLQPIVDAANRATQRND